jgi:sugar transferase (PEP-CTERM/EpsH1 system associated)
MHILWLKSDLLLPLDKGGRLRTWHLMRHLARRHEITYVAFAAPDQPSADVDGMREVARRVVTIPRSEPTKGSLRFYLDAAVHLADPLPYAVGKYRSRAFAGQLRELLAQDRFDLIVCDFVFPAVNLPRTLPCPAVIFTHNVESEIWRRHAETQPDFVRRLLFRVQYSRMSRYERRTLARFDGVLAVSEADRDTLGRLYQESLRQPVHVIPTGVDTAFFSPGAGDSRPRRLVFTGSMDWLPNEDAMVYFAREVLPLIRADEPDVTLSIVGRAPTAAVKRLADDPHIEVTGRVDDVRPFVREAAVYVVPLRVGGGTRLKIFEAMAMGKAVVSTTIGAEGLPLRNGEHLVIADDPRRFAAAVVDLVRHPERRWRLETSARSLVVEKYDWSAVAAEMDVAIARFLGRSPGGHVAHADSRHRRTSDSSRAERMEPRPTGQMS